MKKQTNPLFIIASIVFGLLFFTKCTKNKLEIIDPVEDPSVFSRSLLIGGKNIAGEPEYAEEISDLFITSYSTSALITGDNYLFLPFEYSGGGTASKLFFQVEGANNYWEIPFEINEDNNHVLSIGVPKNVLEGNATLNYGLIDSQNRLGPNRSMAVQIEKPVEFCKDRTTFPRVEGSDGLTVKTYEMGDEAGWVTIEFDTYSIPDRVDIRYNNKWIKSTGQLIASGGTPPIKDCSIATGADGFFGQYSTFTFFYDPAIGKKVDVYVSGCLNDGTAWWFEVTGCPSSRKILGIHSNATPDDAPYFGHTWITLSDSSFHTSYALWPDDSPKIVNAGLNNGNQGSDVRTDFPLDISSGVYSRFYPVDDDQIFKIENFVSRNKAWERNKYNCSTFAQELIQSVIGEEVNSLEAFLNTSSGNSPRRITKSIVELENVSSTVQYLPKGLAQNKTSCSFCK